MAAPLLPYYPTRSQQATLFRPPWFPPKPSTTDLIPAPLQIRRVFTEPLGSGSRRSRRSAPAAPPPLPLSTVMVSIPPFPPKPRPTTCLVPTRLVPREPLAVGPPHPFCRTAKTFPYGLGDSGHSLHRDLVGLASSTTSPIYPRYHPPRFRAFRINSLRAFCALRETLVEPSYCRYLRYIVSSLCEHRPFHRLPGDDTSSWTATIPLTALLRRRRPPTQLFSSPHHQPEPNHQWPFSLPRRHSPR